jgi:DNA topoisomerase I
LLCASELARREREVVPGRTSRTRLARSAVMAVAERLGNTPAVARGSYISPAVLDGFERGEVVGACLGQDDVLGLAKGGGLHAAEHALATFLRAVARRTAGGPRLRALRGGARTEAAGRPSTAVAKPDRRAARGLDR